jgi:hypothetical protein
MENKELAATLITSTAFQMAHAELLAKGDATPEKVETQAAIYLGSLLVFVDEVLERMDQSSATPTR